MTLRVMTWNICHARYEDKDQLPAIERVIHNSGADVVAIQEAPNWSDFKPLADRLGMDLRFGRARKGYHVAAISKLPIKGGSTIEIPGLSRPLVRLDVTWQSEPLIIFSVHLSASQGENKQRRRTGQIKAVLDIMKAVSGQNHLLCGDFNTREPDAISSNGSQPDIEEARNASQLMTEAGYTDCFRAAHPDAQVTPGYTFSTKSPWLRFDYIFASPEMAVRLTKCEVVTEPLANTASDHFPVLAEFA